MSLPGLAICRPIGTIIIYVCIMLLGYMGYKRLAVDLMPDLDFPRISITTSYEGVAPEEIETLITRPIEQAVSTLDGLTLLESVSAEGISRIQLHFNWGTELAEAVNDVRAALERVNSVLPQDADRPTVFKFNLSDVPIAFVSVAGNLDPRRLRYLADQDIGRRLERVNGVAAAEVRGGRIREIQVLLDPDRIAALRVAPSQVIAALRRENHNISAGDTLNRGLEVSVRAIGEYASLQDIGDTVVTVKDGRAILVRDLAVVQDRFAQVRNELWINNDHGIRIRIRKQAGANTVEVVNNLKKEIEAINRDYAGRLHLQVLQDAAVFIKQAITNVSDAAILGGLLAVLVLLIFLRDIRATFVVATAIPISVLASFGVMHQLGYSLNLISFGALALSIGNLVDNAIVILESIVYKYERGLSAREAAEAGTLEVWLPVVGGTLTTLVVFIPVIFISGFTGVFFREMAVIVVFSQVISLIVAVTLVPSLAAIMLSRPQHQPGTHLQKIYSLVSRGLAQVESSYEHLLKAALQKPFKTLAQVAAVIFTAFALWPLIQSELLPETDEGRIDIDIKLPIGTPVEYTATLMREAETRVLSIIHRDELENIVTAAGPENPWQTSGGHEGKIDIQLVAASARSRSTNQIIALLREQFNNMPGVDARIRASTSNIIFRLMRGGSGERLVLEIYGHNLQEGARFVERVLDELKQVPGVADARIDREQGAEERAIRIDRERAAQAGLTVREVAETIQTYLLGQVATKYREAGDEYDVRVRLFPAERLAWREVADLPIVSSNGGLITLNAIAHFEPRQGPASIARKSQQRLITISAGIEQVPLSYVLQGVKTMLNRLDKPSGFEVRIGGEREAQAEGFGELGLGIALALFLVFAVMAIQFESLKQPLLVMISVPLGMAGVILMLVLTNTTFNLNTFLGIIVMIGIVVNNAIIFVDYANLLTRQHGYTIDDALIETGKRRLRPILMTTATTVLGLIPIAVGLGEGGEIQAPLGRALVGGLTASTLMTLMVLPLLYRLTYRSNNIDAPKSFD